MPEITEQSLSCPYCGERFETMADCSAGDASYIEDCYVCCRPIVFELVADSMGRIISLTTRAEND